MVAMPQPVLPRFCARIRLDEASGCWLWTAGKFNTGYGKIGVGRRQMLAHRASYELFVGPIPMGLVVRHSCDNKGCVNPDHLLLGTQADNMADMAARGRARGGDQHRAKTHCPEGHPYSGENLRVYVRPDGIRNRVCRECRRTRQQMRRVAVK